MKSEVEDEELQGTPEDLIAFLENRSPVVHMEISVEEKISELVKIDDAIQQKTKAIKELLELRRSLEDMNVFTLAETLHARHCQKGHDSSCKWNYENWEEFKRNTSANTFRKPYYDRAVKLINTTNRMGISVHQALLLDEISNGK